MESTQEPTANSPKNKKKISLLLVGTFILLIVVIIAIDQTGYFGKNLTRIEPSPTLIPTPIISVGDNVLGDNVGQDIIFPADSGIINVKNYGVKGDGITDDTQAILRAIRENLGGNPGPIIYFPSGTYLVSDRLDWRDKDGKWQAFMTFQGQNRNNTIIKLKDKAPGYTDSGNPKAVIFTAAFFWESATAGGKDWTNLGEGGTAFRNFIFDLTVDTGSGNPGAIGIDYLVHNIGSIRSVTIRSGDGQGYAGLDMTRKWPGPGLVKDVLIEGFSYGILVDHSVYAMTLEHITLKNQGIAGILNRDNVLSIRDLKSVNSVPAIQNTGLIGLVALVDGSFTGGSPSRSAIENAGGLFARNIETAAYRSAITNKGTLVPGTSISEFVSSDIKSVFASPQKSFNLPVQEPPEIPWDPVEKWASVTKFGAKSNIRTFDNTPAFQAAIDSGATTIYVPIGRYLFGDTVYVRANVRRIHFMGSWAGHLQINKFGSVKPLFQFEQTGHPVIIERIGNNWSEPSWPGPGLGMGHVSSQPLIIRNGGFGYRSSPGSGPLFLEDVGTGGGNVFKKQDVWARQLNPEGNWPMRNFILNDGANLWILGLKTEGANTVVETVGGGRTEVLGGMIFPVNTVPADMPAFISNDSSHSLSFVINAYQAETNHEIVIKETRGGATKQLTKSQVLQRGHGSMVPFYAGYIAGATIPTPTPTPTPTPSGSDITPPVISNIQPQGALPFSTKEVTITLETSEPAQCAISESPGLIDQPNPQLFTTTGATFHSITAPPVEKGKSYTLYARCKDEAGNITPEDTVIQFSIAKSEKASPLSRVLLIVIIAVVGIGVFFFIERKRIV